MTEKANKIIKHAENLIYKGKMKRGDVGRIANETNRTVKSVRDIFNGRRSMPDDVLEALVKILERRQELQNKIKTL